MSKKYKDSRRSPEYQRKIKIGRALAACLPQIKTQAEVAKELGISRFTVGEVEALALYKLFARAHQLKRAGLMDDVVADSNVEGERSFFALQIPQRDVMLGYE